MWTAQCPYLPARCQDIVEVSEERGLRARSVRVNQCREARAAVSPYGTFSVLLDGRLITYQ